MNILLAIAHYAQPTALCGEQLTRCLVGWRGLAESGLQDFGGPCQATRQHQLDIIVVDDGVHTARDYVPMGLAEFVHIEGDPLRLPLVCRSILDERRHGYDMLGYSEHDNWPITPDYFEQAWAYAIVTGDGVLIPDRYECISQPPYKVYIDGKNGWGNYGAMWLVTQAQWAHWREQSHFIQYADQFAGPLESGCAWSLLRTFRCTKVHGLESEHIGDRYAQRSISRGVTWD